MVTAAIIPTRAMTTTISTKVKPRSCRPQLIWLNPTQKDHLLKSDHYYANKKRLKAIAIEALFTLANYKIIMAHQYPMQSQ